MSEDDSRASTRFRFPILLAALLVQLLVVAVASAHPNLGWLAGAVFIALLISAVHAVSTRRIMLVSSSSLVAAFLILKITDTLLEGAGVDTLQFWVRIAGQATVLALLSLVCVLILSYIFRTRTVSRDTIAAALSVYIILGVVFAAAYSLLELLVPDSFSRAISEVNGAESHTAMYFSFVTLTTVGYGDITPRKEFAQMLSAVEGITGQFYLTVLVAWLVGQYIGSSQSKSEESRPE